MQYEVEIGGRLRRAAVHRDNGTFVVEIDGRQWTVDAGRVDAQSLSLLIKETAPASSARTVSHEVTVVPDDASGRVVVSVGTRAVAVSINGRRSGRSRRAVAADGPQRILAPMPGKVVRVLASPGDEVHARQPVIVIEAMKMENELRAGRDGVVAEIHAREGQSVEAGELLAVVAAAQGTC